MEYRDINNKWKQFLAENAFKEDIVIKPEKKKKKKKKEIIVSEKQKCMDEGSDCMEEYEELEEMSAMSGGAVQGYAGGLDDEE